MTDTDLLPANFTISSEAKRGIELVRQAFNAHSPKDHAAVASVGWGIGTLYSGEQFEQVFVSFYSRSQFADIADIVQRVSGIDLVFFTTPAYRQKFEGKILDFDDERGFFLH